MRARNSSPSFFDTRIRPVLVGVGVGALGCMGLLMLMALIIQSVDVPRSAVLPLSIAAAAGGAFIAGLVSAAMAGRRGLLVGVVCGLVLFLLILAAGIARYADVSGGAAAVKLAVLVLCGGIGGVLGVNMRKHG